VQLTATFVNFLIAIFIGRAVAVGQALHFKAARCIADITGLALATCRVIQNGANGIQSAIHEGARIRAVVLNAGLRVRTI
jgi:hypothetical protein